MTAFAHAARGCILGAAIGDALGAPFEGASCDARLAEQVARRAASATRIGYTDDTEMLIGVAESLIERAAVDDDHLLRTLAENHEPARGYGRGMKLAFRAFEAGEPIEALARSAWAEGSWGNGAAVRVVPIAVRFAKDRERLIFEAAKSARLTHAHPLAVAGAVVHGVAVAKLLCGEFLSPESLIEELIHLCPPDAHVLAEKLSALRNGVLGTPTRSEVVASLGNGVSAAESVPLALYGFLRWRDSFEQCLVETLSFGGDTDSIGCLVGALAGAYLGDEAIPRRWIEALEDGHRGRQHLELLADALTSAPESGASSE